MKTNTILIGITFFLSASFHIPFASADAVDIVISSLQITGGTGHTKDEFVELSNLGSTPINISGWELRKKTKNDVSPTGELFHKFLPVDCHIPATPALTDTIPAHGHLLWTNKDGDASFTDNFDVQSGNKESPSLADNNGLALFDSTKNLIDGITWDICSEGGLDTNCFPKNNAFLSSYLEKGTTKVTSIIRDSLSGQWSLSPSLVPKNAGIKICPPIKTEPDPPKKSTAIRLNELFPNPSEKGEANEFIELYNDSDEIVSLLGWTIKKDHSESGQYHIKAEDFPQGTSILARGFFLIPRSLSGFIMANSNKTISLHDPDGTEKSVAQYTKTKEGVSLNYTSTGWRGGIPTPGTVNQPNALPETKEKIPKKGYRGVPVLFDARGKDSDGGKLKYTWDFGDNHKSYKEETSHTYEDNGTYPVTLTTTDGSDDVVETFSLTIQSMPKPNVRITAMIPNPSGKDTDAEWLMIENRGKKSVDLKGFGIATGWKKLVNHPVRESFVIPPKGEAKLTREFSLFTLPNEKGKIELRAPDGDVLQKIKYKLDKSVAEDVVYKKEKGSRWAWQEKEVESATDEAEAPQTISPEIPAAPEEIEPLSVPEEEPEDTQTEAVLLTPSQEAKKLSLLPLLNYGTHVTLPKDIELTFNDSSLIAPPLETEHYALTFAKEVLVNINTVLNVAQNKE